MDGIGQLDLADLFHKTDPTRPQNLIHIPEVGEERQGILSVPFQLPEIH
jgi:hypothetical protein